MTSDDNELTKAELKANVEAVVDEELHKAFQSGYRIDACGLVIRDAEGQISWFNRAHPAFCEVFTRPKTETIAFVGLTEGARQYLHMSRGHEHNAAESASVKALIGAMASTMGIPSKSILFFGRLSRTEAMKSVTSENTLQARSAARQIPEDVKYVYQYNVGDEKHLAWERNDYSYAHVIF